MIPRTELDRAIALVLRSGVHLDLELRLRPDKAGGRPRQLNVEVFLAGIILAASHKKNLALINVHALLTHDISRSAQIHYGIRWTDKHQQKRCLSLRQVRYLLEALEGKLTRNTIRAPKLDDIERAERTDALQSVLDRILAATVPAHLPPAERVALDGTALESWGRGKRFLTASAIATATASAIAAADSGTAIPTGLELRELTMDFGASWDLDAHWGYRTKTYDNKSTKFFGYDVFAVTAMPEAGGNRLERPLLTERIVVTPAATDVVAPALGIFDRFAAEARRIRLVAADRAWSYKLPERWADELRARKIEAVLDLSDADHGARDFEGLRMVAGAPHCPSMPDALVDIRRPATLSAGPVRPRASAMQQAEQAKRATDLASFHARIAERESWSFRRVAGPDETGKERWECPAQAGKRICANCPLSLAYPAPTPTVAEPPALATAPKCCTQRTVTIPGNVTPKIRQRLYWGSPEWIASFSQRTHIEGAFGNLKSAKTENIRRGWAFVVGLVKTSPMLVCAVAAANLRLLRVWAARVGDFTDPLSVPDPEDDGFEELEPEVGAAGITGPPLAA